MNSPILYEDTAWLAVNKPTGLATHAAHPGDSGVVEWLALHLGHQLHVCSRLDKGTSGVLLFAKDAQASAQAQAIHEQQQARKTYHFISKQRSKGGEIWQMDTPLGGKACQTNFRLISKGHGYYCYEAVIRRGRTHQIRQHAALSGVAILGDGQYGGAAWTRLCLHCVEVHWPVLNQPIETSEPDSFSLLLAGALTLVVAGAVAWERRLGWPGLVSNSMRLVQRGELALPVSIDLYDSYLAITGFSDTDTSHELLEELQPVLGYLASKVEWRGGLVRRHGQNPHQQKLIHDTVSWGELLPASIMASEHDLAFAVNLNDSQHVGLFLDQRDSRRRIWQVAKARRVANLFSFTCSFSAMAVAGGAEVVFSIDLAGSSLGRGKENFSINGLDEGGRGKFINEDVRKWLARQERKLANDPVSFAYWDLIICDPPVFASAGKGRGFHVEKEWSEY